MAIKISNSTIIDDGRNIVNAGIVTAQEYFGDASNLSKTGPLVKSVLYVAKNGNDANPGTRLSEPKATIKSAVAAATTAATVVPTAASAATSTTTGTAAAGNAATLVEEASSVNQIASNVINTANANTAAGGTPIVSPTLSDAVEKTINSTTTISDGGALTQLRQQQALKDQYAQLGLENLAEATQSSINRISTPVSKPSTSLLSPEIDVETFARTNGPL